MSSSGGSRGGASLAQGTAAARPGVPATQFYFATDTQELTVANNNLSAWQAQATISGTLADNAAHVPSLNVANNTFNIGGSAAVNSIRLQNVGGGLRVVEGTNAKQGVATLASGTVTVANTSVTASSRIFITVQETGTLTGFIRVSARVVGTSFTISSSIATDTAVVVWEIFEPG